MRTFALIFSLFMGAPQVSEGAGIRTLDLKKALERLNPEIAAGLRISKVRTPAP